MPCKVVDRLANTRLLAVRRVLISGFLMSCLAAVGLALLPMPPLHAQGIRTEVEHRKDMEIYYNAMRDEYNSATTEDDNLAAVKGDEPRGMDSAQWRNWAGNQPALAKWIENYEKAQPPPTINKSAGGDNSAGGNDGGGGEQGGDQQAGGGGQQGGGQQAAGGGQQGGGQQAAGG